MKTSVKVVAVQSKLIGAVVTPVYDLGLAPKTWPFPATEVNLSGERVAEVVAVWVGDLNEGGTLKLTVRSLVTGALGTTDATFVTVTRFEE